MKFHITGEVKDAGIVKDAESALLFLGYSKKEIDGVLGKILKRNKDVNNLDVLIKEALKELGKKWLKD